MTAIARRTQRFVGASQGRTHQPMSSTSSHQEGPDSCGESLAAEPVMLGTWNVSYWAAARLPGILSLIAQLCALQETKLADIPLECARASLKRVNHTLHHGQPAVFRRAGFLGTRLEWVSSLLLELQSPLYFPRVQSGAGYMHVPSPRCRGRASPWSSSGPIFFLPV